jgi:hypothetical protein
MPHRASDSAIVLYADRDQIVAVGAISVQKDNELFRRR